MSKLDVILVFSASSPEPARAAWIESELCAQGLRVGTSQYKQITGDWLEELYGGAVYVAVLFSTASVQSAGKASMEVLRTHGRKVLPISCEPHSKYSLMEDVVHARIFGDSAEVQLNRLVAAIHRS